MTIIDISVTLRPGFVTWENEEAGPRLDWVAKMSEGSEANGSNIFHGSHLGTHLDAPLHFIADGGTVDKLSLDTLIGPCLVVDVSDFDGLELTAAHLEASGIAPSVTRLLLRTRNSVRRLLDDPEFHTDYVAIGPDAAAWVVAHGITLVGVDYLSVGNPTTGNNGDVHRTLLGANIILVETLNLVDVEAGEYNLICLPLKVADAEASPVRAVLVRE